MTRWAIAVCVIVSVGTARADPGPGGSFAGSVSGMVGLGGKFVAYGGISFAAGYHFTDLVGVEVMGALMLPEYSDLVYEAYTYESLTPEAIDLKYMDFAAFGSVVATPVVGFADVYGMQLDYHLYVTAGGGLVSTMETCFFSGNDCSEDVGIGRGVQRPTESSEAYRPAGSLAIGLRVAVLDLLGVHLELRDIFYTDRTTDPMALEPEVSEFVHHGFFVFGVGILL